MKFQRTRIAPTPSGYLHAGNLYSFLLTDALARRAGAELQLRIDDMDTERKNDLYVRDIFETLEFMDIRWQAGPRNISEMAAYSQHQRMRRYEEALAVLVKKNLVYACSCSRTDIARNANGGIYPGTCLHKNLDLYQQGVAWRLDTTKVLPLHMRIPEGVTRTVQLPEEMQHFVIRRKEGYPAYQLTSVVDDEWSGTDFIVRGLDLQASSIAQLYLAQCLDLEKFNQATFLHHVLIKNPSGQKLSKSAGDLSVLAMRQKGMSREEVIRFIISALPPEEARQFSELVLVNS